MAVRVDLIPPALHEKRRSHRRYRIWTLVAAVLIVSTGGIGTYISRQATRVFELRQRSVERHRETVQLRRTNVQLADDLEEAAQILHEAETLRDGHRWSRMVTFVAQHVPDSVLLVMMASDPPRTRSPRAMARANGAAEHTAEELSSATLTLRGYAMQHEDLAGFLRRLKNSSVFEAVTLHYSKREPFLGGEGVAFALTCRW
jgi:Tfp pilus assembly protein PilN